jgi:hypothetical protein
MTWFEIYAMLAPLQIVVAALIVLWFAHWQDKREDRRRSGKETRRR